MTTKNKAKRWLNRLDNLEHREGKASVLKKTTSKGLFGISLTGKPNSKIKGTSDYGLYYDSKGKLTAGIGHLVTEDENPADYFNMTAKEAKSLKIKDLKKHDKEAMSLLKAKGIDTSKLSRYQGDAIKDFVYQLGKPNASKFKQGFSKLKKAIDSGDDKDLLAAVNEFGNSKWGRNFKSTRYNDFRERMLYKDTRPKDEGYKPFPVKHLEADAKFPSEKELLENDIRPESEKLKRGEGFGPDMLSKIHAYAELDANASDLKEQIKEVDDSVTPLDFSRKIADTGETLPISQETPEALHLNEELPQGLPELESEQPSEPLEFQSDIQEDEMLESVPRADLGARKVEYTNVPKQLSELTFEGMGDDLVNKFVDKNSIGFLLEAGISRVLQTNEVDPNFNIKEQDSELYTQMTEGLEADAIVDVLDNSHNRTDFIKNSSLALGKEKRKKEMRDYSEKHPVLSGVNTVGNILAEGAAFMPVGTLVAGASRATKIKRLSDIRRGSLGAFALGETVEQGLQEIIWSKYDEDYEFDPLLFATSIGVGVGLKSIVGTPEADKLFRDLVNNEGGFINIATKEGKRLVDEVADKVGDNQAIALATRITKKKVKVANEIRKNILARQTSLKRRLLKVDLQIKTDGKSKKLRMQKQKLVRQLTKLEKNLPNEIDMLVQGTHPKLAASVNPEFKVSKIAEELGIPKEAVSSVEKTRKFLGLDGVDVDPDFILEGEKPYFGVMRNQLREMSNNRRLNMNETLKYMAGSDTVKKLDELPVIGKLQIGNGLDYLASTDGPVSRFLFNKGNLVSSENPRLSAFYNWMAPDGMGRQGMSKIRAIESQQKYANIYGGELLNMYHTQGNKIYTLLNGDSVSSKMKSFFSPDSYEEAIEPLFKERLLEPAGEAFRAKYGDEIADVADGFYEDFNKLNKRIVERAKELGVEGVDFDATDGWFHRSWDFRKARAVDVKDLQDTVYRAMKSHAETLGIKNIDDVKLQKHARKFAFGLRNADMSTIEGMQSDHIKLLEKLLGKSEGVEGKVIKNELTRLKTLKAKADAGDLANRVQMDINQKLSNGMSLSDLFEDNIIHTQKRYTARMSARIAAAEHGIKNIDTLDDWITDAVDDEIKKLAKAGVKNPQQRAKFVEESMRQDLTSFKHGGMVGLHDLPDDTASDFIRLVKKYNFARLMQYTGISSIAELGGTLVEAGVSTTLGEMSRYLRNHLNDLYLDNPQQYTGRLYDELRTITGVGMEDFSFSSKGMSKATRVFESGTMSQLEKGVDVLGRTAQAPFGGIEKVGRRITANSLAIKWGNHFKGTETGGVLSAFFGSNGVTNRVLENSGFGMIDDVGKFIPNKTYKNISKAMNEFATFDEGGRLIKLNLEKWDTKTAHAFGDAIQMQSNHIMVNPDATTMALWQSTTVGQILNQFRTFTVNATTKVFGSTVANAAISSNRGDHSEMIKAGQKIFWGTSLGVLSVSLRQGIQRAGGDKEIDLFDEGLAKAAAIGFSRSSVAGNLPTISDSMSGFFGYDPIFEKASSVGRSKNFFNLTTTPTGQAIGGAVQGLEKGAQGDFKGSGMQLLKVSPVYRQIGAQQLFNFIDDEK